MQVTFTNVEMHQSPILNPQSSILNPQSSVLSRQFAICRLKKCHLNILPKNERHKFCLTINSIYSA
ncbi:hypothetical protein KsCSTR_15540 [Candidatus Kuenenia stuttgartiensis]|uniref:Uncharacterized protein n=1 Tax=Kuenenia stuttgartiensis TaxID=174633 RepID=Q1Q1N3_KUEST|nr:hypothetical protein KsCSTR_15540 [Candidatus Kuenenia stuttgartiensis]CAJ73910.1 unknown protein [Candidatus Kuenenia stuttgartiensis]